MSSAAFTILSVTAVVWGKSPAWSVNVTEILALAFLVLAMALTIVDTKKERATTVFSLGTKIGMLERSLAEELEKQRQAKPNIKAEINLVLRDQFRGLCLLHTHFINTGNDPVTIKRIYLIHQQGDGKFVSIPFGKRRIVRAGQKRISLALSGRELSRKTESIVTDEVIDILDSLRSSALVKGHARIGWLAFEIPYFSNELESPSLSLLVEDSFGEFHPGSVSIKTYEYGATFQ